MNGDLIKDEIRLEPQLSQNSLCKAQQKKCIKMSFKGKTNASLVLHTNFPQLHALMITNLQSDHWKKISSSWFYSSSFCLTALVISNIVAEIQILINPVNLPENKLPGTELSRAYDKDVAGKPNAYRFLNKTKHFVIDASKLAFYGLLFIL